MSSAVVADLTDLVGYGADAIGASVYDFDQFEAAVSNAIVGVVQVPLSLLDRRFAPLVEPAAAQGMKVYVRSVFLQGTLLAPPDALPSHLRELAPHVQRLHSLGERLGRSPAELALGWLRTVKGIAGIIVGVQSVAELRELSAAARVQLTEHELDELAALPVPSRESTDPRVWGHRR